MYSVKPDKTMHIVAPDQSTLLVIFLPVFRHISRLVQILEVLYGINVTKFLGYIWTQSGGICEIQCLNQNAYTV